MRVTKEELHLVLLKVLDHFLDINARCVHVQDPLSPQIATLQAALILLMERQVIFPMLWKNFLSTL